MLLSAMPAQFDGVAQFDQPKDAHSSPSIPMTSLLQKAKALVGTAPTVDPTPMEIGRRVHSPKRNWRVVMDKIGVLLVLAALQDATEAWCLELGSQRSGRKSMETIQDYYGEVILRAPPVNP